MRFENTGKDNGPLLPSPLLPFPALITFTFALFKQNITIRILKSSFHLEEN